MKIAVCLKQVVTRDWPLRVDASAAWVHDSDASFEMNEPDAYALEAALRLKERHGAEVVVCSAGPERVTQVLREALARGADRGLHVADDAVVAADARTVAHALASALRPEAADLVLTGLQSDDQGSAQTGVILAELLGIPHATIIMDVEWSPPRVRVKRELESGWFQWLSMPTPALLTIQSGINQLRYATLRGIMAAKRKEMRALRPASAPEPGSVILRLSVPEKRKATRFITGPPASAAADLVRVLREEARVLD